jgi:hypothetical protein
MAKDIYTEPEDLIVGAPFLHEIFRTLEYSMTITHRDKNVLRRVAQAARNPVLLATAGGSGEG